MHMSQRNGVFPVYRLLISNSDVIQDRARLLVNLSPAWVTYSWQDGHNGGLAQATSEAIGKKYSHMMDLMLREEIRVDAMP